MTRRGRGEGGIYFEHRPGTEHKSGSDNSFHRGCTGKWRGEVVVRIGGQRVRRRVNGRTKTEVRERLKDLQDELEQGIRTSGSYTVADAVDDWLDGPMAGRSPKTVQTLRELLGPLVEQIGQTVLRDLAADEVSDGLKRIAATRSTRTVRDTRSALVRAVNYAQSRDKVGRNVATLVKAPPGNAPGRPSRALTVTQARAVLRAAEKDRLHAYVVLSLATGIRTEEARALTWPHVHLDADVPYVDVWRSVRQVDPIEVVAGLQPGRRARNIGCEPLTEHQAASELHRA